MQTFDRDRDRKSLQDLAKMATDSRFAMTPPPSSVAAFGPVPSTRSVANLPGDKKDDSGIVDLAAASAADPQAAMRAQTTPLANQSLFDDVNPLHGRGSAEGEVPPPPPVNAPPASYVPPPPPVSAPPSSVHAYQQPAPSVPPPSVGSVPPPPAPYASVHPIAPSLQKKSGAGALVFAFAGVLAIGAAAAGGFLYIRSHQAPAPVAVATPVTPPAPPAVATAEAPKTEGAPAVVAENKPSDGATDLSSLPNAAPAKSGAKVAVRSSAAKPAAAKAEAADKSAADDEAKAKADKAKLDKALAGNDTPAAAPAPPSGPPGDLASALNQASGGGKMQEQKPAAGSSGSAGNIPQKPSQGAVTGALGAVLPAARDCLGPDDPISKASVVFNSDGSVASVNVSGSAAGKPAATCIEKELRKAKVQPFAEPTYTANITIRHN